MADVSGQRGLTQDPEPASGGADGVLQGLAHNANLPEHLQFGRQQRWWTKKHLILNKMIIHNHYIAKT
jgi:hypothetical protein